jgi:hypothetical protein
MPASVSLFKKYHNPIWVETGSYRGQGIQFAIEAGFKEIQSIELMRENYDYCVSLFKDIPWVHIFLGDSSLLLENIISKITCPITFWLDGHYSGEGTALGSKETPLLDELEIIKRHPIKTHTILIDDMRCWSVDNQGFNTDMLKKILLDINPNYNIVLENGYVPNDILAAWIM